ncbi:putative NAD-dependent malic enzyme 2 [BD1-7 clade bacterium]|uniref:Malolactic enzyme n=1 Tax=BD1-7 clade bacterium TaxID=2029982 RepID=A0A5S9PBH8_9GAMM|nr:putative NAD-dependent malic enzyme 2 [BD1-7 clade bacterium]
MAHPKLTYCLDADGHPYIETGLEGKDLINFPFLNKGSAFSDVERAEFNLAATLPAVHETLEEQSDRCYAQYQAQPNDLARNLYLNKIKMANLTLFYFLAARHLTEMLPILYTPTIGDAVKSYSHEFFRPDGLYLNFNEREQMATVFERVSKIRRIDLIVVSDGEGVLGIGDWGVGGMDICIGKLAVYTLCAGINPLHVLPVQLDVGTNNKELLNNPMYLGMREPRIGETEYDAFIDQFVGNVQTWFPKAFLHWEDFGRGHARKNLNRFRTALPSFNDDVQGTGATVLACILSVMKARGLDLRDQRIVVFGAGSAGVGITDQIKNALVNEGMSETQACGRFWLVDRYGLLTTHSNEVVDFQQPYMRDAAEINGWDLSSAVNIGLLDVVRNVKPTILIGASGQSGAFTAQIIETMAEHCSAPLVFPLSNPSALSEAHPKDVVAWSDGSAVIATGSPFSPVEWQGRSYPIAQCNNCYVFPGIGLGVIAVRARQVTDGMIAAACKKLAGYSPLLNDEHASVLPALEDLQEISIEIACAVGEQAVAEGVAESLSASEIRALVIAEHWSPCYLPYTHVMQ